MQSKSSRSLRMSKDSLEEVKSILNTVVSEMVSEYMHKYTIDNDMTRVLSKTDMNYIISKAMKVAKAKFDRKYNIF